MKIITIFSKEDLERLCHNEIIQDNIDSNHFYMSEDVKIITTVIDRKDLEDLCNNKMIRDSEDPSRIYMSEDRYYKVKI